MNKWCLAPFIHGAELGRSCHTLAGGASSRAHPCRKRGRAAIGRVANVGRPRTQDLLGYASDGHDHSGPDNLEQSLRVHGAGLDLSDTRASVGERQPRLVGVGRDGVPHDHAMLGVEFAQHSMDDRAGRLAPAVLASTAGRPEGWPPTREVAFARERDSRPSHPLVPGRLAESHHIGAAASIEVGAQIGQTDLGSVGQIVGTRLPVLIERAADTGLLRDL